MRLVSDPYCDPIAFGGVVAVEAHGGLAEGVSLAFFAVLGQGEVWLASFAVYGLRRGLRPSAFIYIAARSL